MHVCVPPNPGEQWVYIGMWKGRVSTTQPWTWTWCGVGLLW